MRNVLRIILFSMIVGLVGLSFAGEIHTDYGKALEQARRQNKRLAVHFETPSSTRWKLATGGDSWVTCLIDATTEHGDEVAGLFGVKEYPYLAVTDVGARSIVSRHASPTDAQMKEAFGFLHAPAARRSARPQWQINTLPRQRTRFPSIWNCGPGG